MTIENGILSKKSLSLFLRTFRKNLRNKKIQKFSSFEAKSDYDFVGKEMIIFITKSKNIK